MRPVATANPERSAAPPPGEAAPPPQWQPFSREGRLRTHQQMQWVHGNGRTKVGRFLVLKAVPAPDGQPRMAVVTSRRFSLKAVERNRARRLVREAIRPLAAGIQPYWFLFLPRQPIKSQKLAAVAAELRSACLSLEVWRQPAQ